MEIHVHSTLAKEERKESEVTYTTIAQTNKHNYIIIYIARDTWMPSLENWGGSGLKIFYVYMYNVAIAKDNVIDCLSLKFLLWNWLIFAVDTCSSTLLQCRAGQSLPPLVAHMLLTV